MKKSYYLRLPKTSLEYALYAFTKSKDIRGILYIKGDFRKTTAYTTILIPIELDGDKYTIHIPIPNKMESDVLCSVFKFMGYSVFSHPARESISIINPLNYVATMVKRYIKDCKDGSLSKIVLDYLFFSSEEYFDIVEIAGEDALLSEKEYIMDDEAVL